MSASTPDYGWVGGQDNRERVPSHTPDMAALIDGEDEADARDDLAACGEVMRGVFAFVFAQRDDAKTPVKLDLAFRRFVCLVWLLRPELLGNISLSQLAPHMSVTRAALSKMVRSFGDALGIRNALMKRESARAIYSQTQLRDHWRHREKKAPVAAGQQNAVSGEVPHV
jgi:hypothetical protein